MSDRIARVSHDADERLGATEPPEGARRGELHVVLLVGQREDDGVRRRVAPAEGQRVDGGPTHLRLVVRERSLQEPDVVVAQRLRRRDRAEQNAPEHEGIVPRSGVAQQRACGVDVARSELAHGVGGGGRHALVVVPDELGQTPEIARVAQGPEALDGARHDLDRRVGEPLAKGFPHVRDRRSFERSYQPERGGMNGRLRLAGRGEQRLDGGGPEEPDREVCSLGHVVVAERVDQRRYVLMGAEEPEYEEPATARRRILCVLRRTSGAGSARFARYDGRARARRAGRGRPTPPAMTSPSDTSASRAMVGDGSPVARTSARTAGGSRDPEAAAIAYRRSRGSST